MIEYELMYIVPTSFTEEETGTIEQAVSGMLTKVGATVTNTVRLGKLRLAYPIKRQLYGYYVLVHFQSEPSGLKELNELLRLSPDKVLRHLILRADEVGGDKYQLVQFQEVNVEDRADRSRKARGARSAARSEDKAEDAKAQKEGVAALESDEQSTGEAPKTLSEEELDKKIDQALEEKA